MGWRKFFRRCYWDEERARELEAHLAIETDDNIARGMTPEAARRAALRKLGNPTRIREEIYAMNTVAWIDTLRLDLRDAWRQVRRRARVALLSVLLLALGIGASTAAFTIAYGTLWRPLRYPDAPRLGSLWQETHGRREQVSFPDLQDLRTVPTFEIVAALASGRGTLTIGNDVDRVTSIEAEPQLLPMLGARAAVGRLPDAEDTGRAVAVISHRLWARAFHGEPTIVGRLVDVSGQRYTIIGALADDPDFELPVGGAALGVAFTIKDVDLWTPFDPTTDLARNRAVSTYEALVKLVPGSSFAQAQDAVETVASNLARQFPDTNHDRGFRVVPLRDQIVTGRATAIWVGFGGALIVLAIACVNVVSLSLGELPSRRRDFALREALGAGRARLLRQVVLESVLLASLAAAIGLAIARVLVRAFTGATPLPRVPDIRFDLPVACFAIAAAFGAALCARLAPMSRLEGGPGGLRESTSASAVSAPMLRRLLVAGQVALALVLCADATLFGESLRALLRVDPGFRPEHVLSTRVSAYPARHPAKADAVRFFNDLVAEIRNAPAVSMAAAGSSLPLSGSSTGTSVMMDGQPLPMAQRPTAGWQTVTPGYFTTLGMRMISGRDFEPRDLTRPVHHVVINQSLARRLVGDADPIGKRIALGSADPVVDWHEIVGVVADVRHTSLTETPSPRAYDLFGEHWSRTMFVVTRGQADAHATLPIVREAIHRLDPEAPLFEVRSLDEILGAAAAARRTAATIAAGVALASLLLAVLGVYGLLGSSVATRTREIGIRRALGSSTGRTIMLVVREALTLALAGIFAGVLLTVLSARVIQSQLYGVAATEPLVLVAVAAALASAAAAAALGPAWRAARVDPSIVLRAE
jgi:predicted permease